MSEIVESEKLKQIIGKIENIEAERQEIAEQLKDTYNEAKAQGFDVETHRKFQIAKANHME